MADTLCIVVVRRGGALAGGRARAAARRRIWLRKPTRKTKIGDGLTAWNDLPYMKAGTPLGAANAGRGVMIDVSNPEVPVFSVPGYEGGAGIDITNGVITNTRAGIVLAGCGGRLRTSDSSADGRLFGQR
ncbi:hypothetical protein [Xylella fastidiosa]|uniref:hypothetical protein n=1 Tax=Xylella fastidiosa TaxID=2371 RepID=UPI003AFA8816